jgi:RHS repeat-associated protein
MKFTGHERDLGVLGSNVDDLDYMHARYYRPLVGRFLSVDPLLNAKRAQKNPQSWNRYAYVESNPQRFADLDGRELGLDVNMLARTNETPLQSMAMGAAVGILAVGFVLAPEAVAVAAPASDALFGLGVKYQSVINFFRNIGAGATDTPTTGNLSRSLTPADLGLKGSISELKGTFSVADGAATVKVDMIRGSIQNPLRIVANLIKLAAESGASTLRIEGNIANPKLLEVLTKRWGMQTQGGTDFIVIVIKKPT